MFIVRKAPLTWKFERQPRILQFEVLPNSESPKWRLNIPVGKSGTASVMSGLFQSVGILYPVMTKMTH